MRISTSNVTNAIELKLTAYHDCDDVQLFLAHVGQGQADTPVRRCRNGGLVDKAFVLYYSHATSNQENKPGVQS